jgi:uncharacterized protein YndB with AHSA1/START domain
MTLEVANSTTDQGAEPMAVQQLGNETTTAYADGQEFVMERIFDAPRELVWKVMTDPARVTNWWGPRNYTTTVVEMDVRPGGKWRFINHTTAGEDVPFKGEYLEVEPPKRIVQTFIWDVPGFDDKAAVETLTLEDLGKRTKVVLRDRFPSAEDLQGAVSMGMVGGAIETWDRLAEEFAKG